MMPSRASGRPPLAPPSDLTIGGDESQATYAVWSRALGRAINEAHPILRARLGASYAADLGAIASAVRRPEIGVLVRAHRTAAPDARDAIATELAATVAFDHACARALPEPIRLEGPPRRILSSAAGVALDIPDDASAITFGADRVVIERASGNDEIDLDANVDQIPFARLVYYDVDADVLFATEDNNPLAMLEAHPEKSGNAVDLGDETVERWLTALREALAIVREALPWFGVELGLLRPTLVPVGYDPERHFSASYREALGTAYLSLHPSVMTMAEAIVHELSHNKLNALFECDDVIENAFEPLYASPVRPDPRPLHGILLAVHAFLPIARMYEEMIVMGHALAESAAFRARFEEIVRINREGAEVVLANARPTTVGRALLDEIARWDAHYRRIG
jgi:HEXXH motif-containing protein